MFVIVNNNSVILGPMRWNRFRFENEIKEELDISISLPDKNTEVITVDDNTKIYPVIQVNQEEFNSKIQHLNGPFWQFTETGAIASYIAKDLPIDAVKNQLKELCASERYNKEIAGVKTTIQDLEVTVDTARGSRDIFVQKYLLMNDTDVVQWKFPEGWLTLTKADLGQAVSIGAKHVQDCFNWEAEKIVEIESCVTLEQLDGIVIVESTNDNNQL